MFFLYLVLCFPAHVVFSRIFLSSPKRVLDLKMVGPLKVGFQQNNKKIGEGHLQDMAPETL